jgi:hypothetical protein
VKWRRKKERDVCVHRGIEKEREREGGREGGEVFESFDFFVDTYLRKGHF